MQIYLALIAAAACALLGMLAARRLQEREKLLQSWESALRQMALIAAHRPAGIPDLLRQGAGNDLPDLIRAADRLEKEPALSPDDFLARIAPDPLLTPPEAECIREGIKGLFSPDPAIQIQFLSCAREQLAHFARISREAAEKNSRLYLSLGYLAGAALFILMC